MIPNPTDAGTSAPPQQAAWEGWHLEQSVPHAYESYLVPALFAPWAERLVQLAAPQPGERVLDIACGTGIVARCAAAAVGADGSVVGVDRNARMLDVARAASVHAHPPIGWRAGDATDLPFPDGAFEIAFCQQGLQFFADPALTLREMHRVLVPGGRVALAMWRPIQHSSGFALLAEALERHAGADAAAVMRAPFAGPDADALRQLVTDAGFGGAKVGIGIGGARFPSPEEFLRQQAASSPLAGPVEALDAAALEALTSDLVGVLRPYLDDNGLLFPVQTWLITGRR